MAVTVASPIYKSTAGRTRQVFNSHTIYRIPGIEDFSTDELNAACADIQHSENTTDLNGAALYSALQSVLKDRCSPAPSSRSRSLTLPLDEDADDETGQETDNEKFMSIHKTTGHAHRVNTTSKVITRNIQKRKSKASQVLKPVSSRISKQSPNKRSLQRRIPKQQYEAKQLGEKTGSSPKIRQDKPQESNLTSPATLPTHQVDQPGDLNNRQNSRGRQVRPHRASIALPPHSTQPATRRRAIALQNKKINPESPTSSIARKRRRRNSAQGAWHSKQENRQRSPQEYKTKSGRVSKRPERLGFTW